MDCGLITNKGRGSLTKKPGRRGMFESVRLDLDRMAQERLDPDLILGVDFRSGGRGLLGARAAA